MGRRPAAVSWVIIYVLVFSTCVDAWPVSETGARVSWAVTWSPGNELHHLAVDPVSGKVILMLRSIGLGNSYFPSRKSGCSQNSEFPTWKYDFRHQWNDIFYRETRKYE